MFFFKLQVNVLQHLWSKEEGRGVECRHRGTVYISLHDDRKVSTQNVAARITKRGAMADRDFFVLRNTEHRGLFFSDAHRARRQAYSLNPTQATQLTHGHWVLFDATNGCDARKVRNGRSWRERRNGRNARIEAVSITALRSSRRSVASDGN